MKLVLTGPKCSGKSLLGKKLADLLSVPFYETDLMIEECFKAKNNSTLTCRSICSQYGEDFFRDLEKNVIISVAKLNNCIISTGGSTMLNANSRTLLRENSILILVTASLEILLKRLSAKEIPAFLNDKTALDLFAARACLVTEVVKPLADITIDSSYLSSEETISCILKEVSNYMYLLRNAIAGKLRFIEACQAILKNSDNNQEADLNILKLALEL